MRARLIAAFAAVYLIWGSTYLAIRFAVQTLPPLLMASARFVIAGTIVLLWARLRDGVAWPNRVEWRVGLIGGALLLLGGNGGVSWAEQRVPSGITALLVAVVPVFVVLLEWLRPGGRRPSAAVFAGVGLGLVGLALLAAAVVSGEPARLSLARASTSSLVAFAYLLTFGSLIGFTAYVYLLSHTTAAKASTYAYVNPVVAVLLGWAIGQEPVTTRTLLAAAVILAGVAIITITRDPTAVTRAGR
jgi:drug/metabolite transporter (DMT)-like permease